MQCFSYPLREPEGVIDLHTSVIDLCVYVCVVPSVKECGAFINFVSIAEAINGPCDCLQSRSEFSERNVDEHKSCWRNGQRRVVLFCVAPAKSKKIDTSDTLRWLLVFYAIFLLLLECINQPEAVLLSCCA